MHELFCLAGDVRLLVKHEPDEPPAEKALPVLKAFLASDGSPSEAARVATQRIDRQ